MAEWEKFGPDCNGNPNYVILAWGYVKPQLGCILLHVH
jgi:hypothetical protein